MVQGSGDANRYVDIAGAVLMVAVFSLTWRVWHTGTFIAYIPIPELFIFSAGLTLAACAVFSSLPRIREFTFAIARQYWFVIVLSVAPLLGLLGSSLAGLEWQGYLRRIAIDYAFLLLALLFFAISAYIVFIRPHTLKSVFAAVAASSLPFWLALYPLTQPLFLVQNNRLRGAASDPNQFAAWIVIGLIASIVFFLWEKGKVRWRWLAVGLAIAPLLLWTASRAAWFAVTATLIIVGIHFLAEKFSWKRVGLLGTAFIGVVVALILGFYLFPVPSRVVIATRAASPFVNEQQLLYIASKVAGASGFIPEFEIPPDNRTLLWQEGLKILFRSPLGFGPAYYLWNPVMVREDGYKLGAHSAWIDSGLTGGWIGFGAWVLLMITAGRAAVKLSLREEPQLLALAASFFAIVLLSFFLDTLTFRWFWLVIGLIVGFYIAYGEQEKM
jgi:O-antigen ligase